MRYLVSVIPWQPHCHGKSMQGERHISLHLEMQNLAIHESSQGSQKDGFIATMKSTMV